MGPIKLVPSVLIKHFTSYLLLTSYETIIKYENFWDNKSFFTTVTKQQIPKKNCYYHPFYNLMIEYLLILVILRYFGDLFIFVVVFFRSWELKLDFDNSR